MLTVEDISKAKIKHIVVNEPDQAQRYATFFDGIKVGTLVNRTYGVALQWRIKDDFTTVKITTCEEFLTFVDKIIEEKKLYKSKNPKKDVPEYDDVPSGTIHEPEIEIEEPEPEPEEDVAATPSKSFIRKMNHTPPITDDQKEIIAKKIITWVEKNNRYNKEFTMVELVGDLKEARFDIEKGIAKLFDTHEVVQISASRFKIIEKNETN